MTDTPVETHVVVDEGDGRAAAIHFQEWWVRHAGRAAGAALRRGRLDRAAPAPGVLDAIREADVVLLPPSNPVVSIGIILGVPGVRDALRGTPGARRRGLAAGRGRPGPRPRGRLPARHRGRPRRAGAVAGLYADFLDGWLVDVADKELADAPGRLRVVARPL